MKSSLCSVAHLAKPCSTQRLLLNFPSCRHSTNCVRRSSASSALRLSVSQASSRLQVARLPALLSHTHATLLNIFGLLLITGCHVWRPVFFCALSLAQLHKSKYS